MNYLENITLIQTRPCLVFAVGLLQQKRELAECMPLMVDSDLADRRATLETML